jgi:hypothetical protein
MVTQPAGASPRKSPPPTEPAEADLMPTRHLSQVNDTQRGAFAFSYAHPLILFMLSELHDEILWF